jgi:hypothetical protein
MRSIVQFIQYNYNPIEYIKEPLHAHTINITASYKAQIYRSVASSTAIETGVSVQKIEQQLKIRHRRKPLASPASLARYRLPAAS